MVSGSKAAYRKCPKYSACAQDQLLALGVIWEHREHPDVGVWGHKVAVST